MLCGGARGRAGKDPGKHVHPQGPSLGQRPANAQLSKIGNIFSGSEVRKWMIDDGLLPIIQLIRQNIVFIRYDQWFNFLFHHCVLEIHSL